MSRMDVAKYLITAGVSASVALGGAHLLLPHEGEVRNSKGEHVVYADPVGIPTACWGLTGKDLYGKPFIVGNTYSQGECLQMFAPRINGFAKSVNKSVKTEWASPYQEAAMVSFAYNIGMGAFNNSTLLKLKNSGNDEATCEQLSRWVYAKGRKLNGLVTRREDEKAWCLGLVDYDVTVQFSELVDFAVETWGGVENYE